MPLEKVPVGSPGFSHNISEMVKAGHPQAQAIAAAYRAAGERKDSRIDALFAAADALFSRADAMERGNWGGVADGEAPGWKEHEHHRRPTGEFTRPPEDEELK